MNFENSPPIKDDEKNCQVKEDSDNNSKLDSAIKSYEKNLIDFQKNRNKQGTAETFNKLGSLYADKGELDKAIEYYEKSIQVQIEIGDISGEGRGYYNLGLVYSDKDEWDKALEIYNKSAEILTICKDEIGLSLVFGNIASIYYIKGKWDEAKGYFEKSIQIQEKIGDVEGLLRNYNSIASLFSKKGEWSKAIEFYEKHFKIAKEIPNHIEMGRSYNNIAILIKKSDPWKAKQYLDQSLEFFKNANYETGVASVMGNIGIFALEIGEWNIAMEYLSKDLEISTRKNSLYGIAESKNNLGLLFSTMGEFDKAIEFYQNSLEIFEKLCDTEKKAIVLNNLGDLQIKAGDWNNAKRNLEESLNLSSSPHDKIGALLNMGNLLKKEKEYEEAKLYFDRAFEIIEKIGVKSRKIEFLNELGELYFSWYCSNKNEENLNLAREHFEEGLRLSKEYTMPLSAATSLRNIGLVQAKLNEVDEAIRLIKESIEVFNKLGSNYESASSAITLAKILFENGNREEAEVMVKRGLFDSIRKDFKILQIEGHILLGDLTQSVDYYLDSLRISKFNSKIYMRTCYLILEHIKKVDDNVKIKLLQRIKDVNQDEHFENFLNILIAMLIGKEFIINDELPSSLQKELHVFSTAKNGAS